MQVINFFCIGHDELPGPELDQFFFGEWNSNRRAKSTLQLSDAHSGVG